MRKIIIFLLRLAAIVIFALVLLSSVSVSAADEPSDELLRSMDAELSELQSATPTEASDFMSENNISISEPQGITSLSPKAVFSYILQSAAERSGAPLRLLGRMLGIILLAAVVTGLTDSVSNPQLVRTFETASVLAAAGVISAPISEAIGSTSAALDDGGIFMTAYIPVFTGVAAASGSITSASSYGMIVFFAAEIAVRFSSAVILPLLGMCCALTIVEAINPRMSLSGMTAAVRKAASILICFTMTVFVGLLSLQSIIGTSADTVAVKAAKFVVSNAVPIVGGAVSDAYSTVRASLSMLKGGVGVFGIIALAVMLLPPIIDLILVSVTMNIGAIAAELFGIKQLNTLLIGVCGVLKICLALLICFSLIFIVSTAIVMSACINV